MTEKGCDNCYYSFFDERAYPCSLCIRGIERTDMWQPSKKTKADYKTEPKPICESCSKNPCKKKKMINDIGHWVSECTEFDRKTEPQRDCFLCKWLGEVDVCGRCRNRNLFAEAEPQTERSEK